MPTKTIDDILQENAELRRRLDEAEETIRALREGEVDAVVIEGKKPRVFTLDAAEKPYRLLVEHVPEAAATLMPEGTIIYANRGFTDLLLRPLQTLMAK